MREAIDDGNRIRQARSVTEVELPTHIHSFCFSDIGSVTEATIEISELLRRNVDVHILERRGIAPADSPVSKN
jgi:hypothetical protein